MKTLLKIAGGLIAVLLVLAGGAFAWASWTMRAALGRTYDTHRIELQMPRDADARAAAVARGQHLVDARYSCTACHGANFGGGEMIDDGAIGRILGPNITAGRGGRTATYTSADWDRIVRHGVKPDGRPAVMPSSDFFAMSDQELADIVAYITSRPAVDADVPAPTFGPVGTVLVALGKFPLSATDVADHQRAHAPAPPESAVTVAFGKHLSGVCTGCHRTDLSGGPMAFGPPSWPAAANLTPAPAGLAGWTFEDFDRVMTTGLRKVGVPVTDPMIRVVPYGQQMTDVERRALWLYLTTLPPTPTGR